MSSPADFQLTPETLANRIAPALSGFEKKKGLERVSSDIEGIPYQGRITSISQASPVSISVSGWEKVLDLFKLIFGWGREHAHTMASLKEEKLEAEIENIRSEAAKGYAQAKQIMAEADRIDAETRLRRKEMEFRELKRRKMELRFLQEKIHLADTLFDKLAGEREVHKSDRQAYIQRLTEALDLIIGARIEFQVQRVPKENHWLE